SGPRRDRRCFSSSGVRRMPGPPRHCNDRLHPLPACRDRRPPGEQLARAGLRRGRPGVDDLRRGLGLRRKVPTWRLGRATTWMKGHLWLGLLSFPLIWLHAGFQLGSLLTIVLMVLFTLLGRSGMFGVVVQQFLPRLMMVEVRYETIYEQIDSVVAQLNAEAAALVASVCGPLQATAAAASGGPRGGGGLAPGQATPRPTPRPLPPSMTGSGKSQVTVKCSEPTVRSRARWTSPWRPCARRSRTTAVLGSPRWL